MTREQFLAHFAHRPDIARRVRDVTFDPDTGCWLWPGARYTKVGPQGRRRYIHRIALEIKLGRVLGTEHALHSCDTPPCCNPAHLRPGDAKENARDMVARGRARNKTVFGIANNKATLTDEQIVQALNELAAGETVTAVAARWGVTRRAVTTWRDGTARLAARELWADRANQRVSA